MKENMKITGFEWSFEIYSQDGDLISADIQHNLIPSSGLDFLIRSPFGEVSTITSFYLGLYRGNFIPSPNTTSVDIPGNMVEFVDYSEPARPEWQKQLTGIATYDNAQHKAEFTVTKDRTIHGAFLVSDPTKGGNSGLLLSCVRFSSPRNLEVGQTVKLTGGITYSSTSLI